MELFTEITNGWKPLTFPKKSSILDIQLGPENTSRFKALNYFHQKLHLRKNFVYTFRTIGFPIYNMLNDFDHASGHGIFHA